MQLLSKYSKGIRFLLCVIDICNAYFKKCLRDNDMLCIQHIMKENLLLLNALLER